MDKRETLININGRHKCPYTSRRATRGDVLIVYIYIYSFSSTKINSDRSLRESISAAKNKLSIYMY
jgi:hypothetical protein